MRKIVAGAFPKRRPDDLAPGDEAPPDVASVAEDICPKCNGDGMVGADTCPECEGTGRVIKAVGGG